jgi:(E)-4-hydroxy-3-methylbut-2-enyl-diphosphate synthase
MKLKKNMTRKKTRVVAIGQVKIGGKNPILVQSMTNTDTRNVSATLKQIKELEKAGCEIIRVSVPDLKSAQALKAIKKKINIPLVADIHFDWRLAVESIKQGADKIRINPGNIGSDDNVKEIVKAARKNKVAIRVGINSGSLPKDILKKNKDKVTAQGMAQAALRSINTLEKFNFRKIVVSVKSSDVVTAVECYKIISSKGDWPLHLGITESGRAMAGIVKSSMGIGSLILQGIGDTIRVSLSGDPVQEVKAGWEILKSASVRERGLTVVSCPTCARTKIPVEKINFLLEKMSEKVEIKPTKIAVMGCIVNGLGEAKEADFAFVGIEKNKASFFEKGKFVCNLEPKEIALFAEKLIKKIK